MIIDSTVSKPANIKLTLNTPNNYFTVTKGQNLADTTNALSALDSLLYNLDNRIDPQIPDTSDITPIHEAWLHQL